MTAKLHYWKGRGRAEIIRLTLAAAGLQWEDAPYLKTAEDVQRYRSQGLLYFNQFPLLEIDGKKLVQTHATIRYIANKHGMSGNTNDDRYRVDLLAEGLRDFYAPFIGHMFMPDEAFQTGIQNAINRYMPVFEKALTENGTGYLVGDGLTFADVQLLEVLLAINDFKPATFDKFDKLKKFYEKMSALPSIAKYLKSEKRFGPNTAAYVADVKASLGL